MKYERLIFAIAEHTGAHEYWAEEMADEHHGLRVFEVAAEQWAIGNLAEVIAASGGEHDPVRRGTLLGTLDGEEIEVEVPNETEPYFIYRIG